MGLFGSRKKTYVDSVIYNMAGDYSERTNYLKYLTMNGVLSTTTSSVADTIVSGTLNGPRMNYRAFYRWAATNYPEGMPAAGISNTGTVLSTQIEPHITTSSGKTAGVEDFFYGPADYLMWVEDWLLDNNPDALLTEYSADIDDATKIITIYYTNATIATFVPDNFDPTRNYLYARYREVAEATSSTPVFVSQSGEFGPYASESSLPNLTGYALLSTGSTVESVPVREITRVSKTYSDSRPPVNTEVFVPLGSLPYTKITKTYEKQEDIYTDPLDPDRLLRRISRVLVWQYPELDETLFSESTVVTEIEPGIFETALTEIFHEVLGSELWWYRNQEWKLDQGAASTLKMFIYQLGSGNSALDALYPSDISKTGYFPTIPLRINNVMIDEAPYDEEFFDKAKLAYKRASSGGKISKLLDELYDNEDLNDIDFAFLVWGVPLNTRSREGKLYIYHFFKQMAEDNAGTYARFLLYVDQMVAWTEYTEDLTSWLNTPVADRPVRPTVGQVPMVEIRTAGQSDMSKYYDFVVEMNGAREEIFSGQWKAGAAKNDVNIVKGTPVPIMKSYREGREIITYTEYLPVMEIFWQESLTQYRKLTVIGAAHRNTVYNNKYVYIDSDDALDDADDSGFIVPMHFELLKKMPVVWANQLCLESMQIVFNCYVVVKKKWYQTFLGSIIIGLVTMGIGAVFAGIGSIVTGAGILGTNAAIGSMFGLTGLSGALAGAIANSIALTIVLNIVMSVASKLGPLGQVLALMVNLSLGNFSGGLLTGNFSIDLNMFLRTENILALTNAAMSAAGSYFNMKAQKVAEEMQEMESAYNKEKKDLQDKLYELTGVPANFDPMILTDVLTSSNETSDSFHDRTLMTGLDIVEIAHALISDYTDIMLDTSV